MLAGSVFSVWFGVQAVAARDAEAEQRGVAERNEARALAINDFLTTDLFNAADITSLGPEATVPELLAGSAPLIDVRFEGDDPMRVEMHVLMGTMYHQTNQYEDAVHHFDTAIGLVESGVPVRALVRRNGYIRRSLSHQITGIYEKAESDARAAIEIAEASAEAGEPWASSYLRAESMNALATVHAGRGENDEAERLFSEIMELIEPEDNFDFYFKALSNRASNLWGMGRAEEAASVARRMIELGDSNDSRAGRVAALTGRFWLTQHLERIGELEEATEIAMDVVAPMEELSGANSPGLAGTRINAGRLLTKTGRYEEAAPLLDRSIEIFAAVFGPYHYEVERHSNMAANIHLEGGNNDAARAARERGLMLRLYVAGPREDESVVAVIPAAKESFGSETLFPGLIADELDALAPDEPVASQFAVNAGLTLAADGHDAIAGRAYLLAHERLGVAERPEVTRGMLAERLVPFYRERGRDADADAWAARLAGDSDAGGGG